MHVCTFWLIMFVAFARFATFLPVCSFVSYEISNPSLDHLYEIVYDLVSFIIVPVFFVMKTYEMHPSCKSLSQ